MNRSFDSYAYEASSYGDLLREVEEMEDHSEWISGVRSNLLSVEALEGPVFALQTADRYGLDTELAIETSEEGTKLLLKYESSAYPVRDTAWPGLCETAKLYGAALGRMPVYLEAETLSNGLSVARGKSLLLMRYGKVSALHSDAEGGYSIMPVSSLLRISEEILGERFGKLSFAQGSNSHGCSSCTWELPDMQDRLTEAYQTAVKNAVSRNFTANIMPAVRFSSSDTANASAALTPMFCESGSTTYFRFADGAKVKHTKRGCENPGTERFREEAGKIYAAFDSSMETVRKLAERPVFHGENAVILLCRKLQIPKKYGEAARQKAAGYASGGRAISALDLYLCMTEVLPEAEAADAGLKVLTNLEEAVAKVLKTDWKEVDVGGTAAW